jgi:hypothetical protein
MRKKKDLFAKKSCAKKRFIRKKKGKIYVEKELCEKQQDGTIEDSH